MYEDSVVEFDIYFDDLTPEAQEQLLQAVGVSDPSDAGWDVMPVTTLTFE